MLTYKWEVIKVCVQLLEVDRLLSSEVKYDQWDQNLIEEWLSIFKIFIDNVVMERVLFVGFNWGVNMLGLPQLANNDMYMESLLCTPPIMRLIIRVKNGV